MLRFAICDDDWEGLETISNMLHEICAELDQNCRIARYQSPDDMLERCEKFDIGILLMKPLDKETLKGQVEAWIQANRKNRQDAPLVFENVRDGKGNALAYVRLNATDILYCECVKFQREVSIVLEHEVYFYKCVFENLSEQLEHHGFAVNCRGSIVNLKHVKKLKGYTIYLDNGAELSLTQKRVSGFKEKLNAYIHNIA